MPDSKTSALPAVASVADAQEFPVNDAGTSKKATAAQVKAYVLVTGASDNRVLRSDGAGGATSQGSLATLQDDGTLVVNAVLVYPSGDLGNDEKVQVAASFLLASDVHFKWYNAVDISSGGADSGIKRAAAGVLVITNGAAGLGQLRMDGTTGAGTPLLGANSPAGTLAAPYTWLKFQAPDGTAVYVPAWA